MRDSSWPTMPARTLSSMIVRAAGYRPRTVGGHYNTFLALEAADRQHSPRCRFTSMAAATTQYLRNAAALPTLKHLLRYLKQVHRGVSGVMPKPD